MCPFLCHEAPGLKSKVNPCDSSSVVTSPCRRGLKKIIVVCWCVILKMSFVFHQDPFWGRTLQINEKFQMLQIKKNKNDNIGLSYSVLRTGNCYNLFLFPYKYTAVFIRHVMFYNTKQFRCIRINLMVSVQRT